MNGLHPFFFFYRNLSEIFSILYSCDIKVFPTELAEGHEVLENVP